MEAARLLRRFHDATLDCSLREGYEVICHGDASPCNCVFVDGVPKACIDFDDAHPGSRLDDLGYAAWLWIDIGNDDLPVESQAERVANFFEHYGMGTDAAISAIMAAQMALSERTNLAAVFEWSQSCRSWVERNRVELAATIARSNRTIQPTCVDARG
jgi:Ser/Thr protein kinase RdoA (MazF antagonist)